MLIVQALLRLYRRVRAEEVDFIGAVQVRVNIQRVALQAAN